MNGDTNQPAKPETGWHFAAGSEQTGLPAPSNTSDPIEWTASEFVANQKSFGWYVLFILGTIVLAAVAYLLNREPLTVVIIFIVALAFGVIAARQPRVLHYRLDSKGLHIENKFYPYMSFKSFSVINEGGINSIQLMPLKRFMPSLSLYCSPEDEVKVVNLLSNYLPHENRQRDAIDRLMHKVRF